MKNNQNNFSIIILAMISASLIALLFASMASAQSGTTKNAKRRQAAWGASASTADSNGLPSTFDFFGGQGGGSYGERHHLCPALLTNDDAEAFIISPERNILYLDYPFYPYDLEITPCQNSSSWKGTLLDPHGTIVDSTSSEYPVLDLPHDAPLGDYELLINTGTSVFTKTLTGSRSSSSSYYSSAGTLTVWDQTSNTELGASIEAGKLLKLEYSNWLSEDEDKVIVGLYRIDGTVTILLDSWQITTTNGNFTEEILIPSTVEPSDYYFVACAIGFCAPQFRAPTSQGYPPKVINSDMMIIEPLIAWRGFTIVPSATPIIDDVILRVENRTNGKFLHQDIYFHDGDGDANIVTYKIIQSTKPGVPVYPDSITATSSKQKTGAIVTGTWECRTGGYLVVLEATIVDKAGHKSNPTEIEFDCR